MPLYLWLVWFLSSLTDVWLLLHNNCSKDNDFDLENYVHAAADDVADDDAADNVDLDALVFTISLAHILSHCCLCVYAQQLKG